MGFSKFRCLPSSQRKLLFDALCFLGASRLGLWILPLAKVRHFVDKVPARHKGNASSTPEQISWAIRSASRYVPRATCLVQAVAAQTLLTRQGTPSQLIIGVALGEEQGFQAHAWVECDGHVCLGETPGIQYKQLLVLTS